MATQLKLEAPCNLIECTDDEAGEVEIREKPNRRPLDGEQRRVVYTALVKLRGGEGEKCARPSGDGEPAGADAADPVHGVTELADKGEKISHPSPNAQPHDKGISTVAKELNVDRAEVSRAVKIETQVTPEAKQAARGAG